MMHHGMEGVSPAGAAHGGMVRRLIFLHVDAARAGHTRADLFGITTTRVPLFFADVAIHWQDLGEALVGARKCQQI